MTNAKARKQCDGLRGATAEYPFGPGALVYKVGGKMFATPTTEKPWRITLKCDPEFVRLLRERYTAVNPGYYMNKQHWNTIDVAGDVPDAELRDLIAQSYELVAAALTKKQRADLG